MNCERKTFIHRLFHFLAGKEYIWLKAILDNPAKTPLESDIDLYVKKEDLDEVSEFIRQQPNLAYFAADPRGTVVFIHLFFSDGSFLKLDLIVQLVRKQWTYLPAEYLFENRIWKNGISTYSTEVLLEHVLLFSFLNFSGLPKKYIGYFSSLPTAEMDLLLSFVNAKYGTDFLTLDDMSQFNAKTRSRFLVYLGKIKENSLVRRILQATSFLMNNIKARKGAPGQMVTFSGVDGAGKTTLLHDLKRVLTKQMGRKVVVLRHRPGMLPILSAWTMGKAAAEQKAASTLPRQGKNHGKVSSLLRFAYYYSDYLIGQYFVWFRYTLPGYTVIYDRYYFDFIVDAKRSNIHLPTTLSKWLYRLVFKPQFNFFLYAPSEVIRRRKKELPLAAIEQLTHHYQSLFEEFSKKYKGQYLCLENLERGLTIQLILQHMFSQKQEEVSPKIIRINTEVAMGATH